MGDPQSNMTDFFIKRGYQTQTHTEQQLCKDTGRRRPSVQVKALRKR